MKRMFCLLAALALMPVAAPAQDDDDDTAGDVVEVTATIKAIDAADRLVTLQNGDGDPVTIYAGPEVKRFSELKVGDQVTFRYAEAVLVGIAEAAPGATPSATATAAVARGTGARPSGGVARQVTATVKVTAVDADGATVAVLLPDGGTRTFGVDDPKDLDGIEVGDLVSITYTQALLISVK